MDLGNTKTLGQPSEGLTRELCGGLLSAQRSGLPAAVRAEARRGILTTAERAAAGSRADAVGAILAAADRLGPPGDIPIPGRPQRVSAWWSCLAVGTAAHAADSHHAAAFAALWPLACGGEIDGRTFVDAFAVGVEAQLRVASAMTPWHHDEGWDIASTTGVLGAAIATAVARGLDAERLLEAIGVAASTTLGTRESTGTMVQPFHAGKAAANGWLAAHLAARGFTGSRGLEAPRGYLSVLSPGGSAPKRVTEGLGRRWLILETAGQSHSPSNVELDDEDRLLATIIPGSAR